MTAPRLRSLSVQGFRCYGATEQTLGLPADIAVVWGPNSKGKTSLAEAFEFLLTGRIARRELMASSQDEFADALRNAHLADGEKVYVAARITAADGTEHEIKRVLTADYAKKQNCASRLEIDGVTAAETDLTAFGITLSQPPLEAPVLAQHTLSYIFSVRPQDRATYFKALLEVTDLDDLRNKVAALADGLTPPDDPLLTKFDVCKAVTALKPTLAAVGITVPDAARLAAKFDDGARALINATGEEVPKTPEERLATVERILIARRSKTFPIEGLARKDLAGWNPPQEAIWSCLGTYVDERKKVNEETRQLAALFDQALNLPAIAGITEPADCPLCGTETALTPERVELIRSHVESTNDFKAAETAAKPALAQLSALAAALTTTADAPIPQYLKITAAKRRETGFTIARIRSLLGERAHEVVDPWLSQIRPFARAAAALRRGAQEAQVIAESQAAQIGTALDPEKLRTVFGALAPLRTTYAKTIESYEVPARALRTALNAVLDARSDSAGWQQFLDIARQPNLLRSALIERQARSRVEKELDTALKEIDRAKEQVLDDKFSDYSATIQIWWERLRPDEPTFFSAVRPRKGARRTIDFKAGLSPKPDRSAPKMRDAIAVFSQSQLHCLGLALFLARAQHEGSGFIILDDPVLSSDEDYRVHFNSTVLTELLKLPLQVIVLTQDHSTWEELETRYRHLGVSNAQLYIETTAEGTIIENTSDALLAKINRASSLARGGHPDSRKECGIQLRDAGERFCKEMLVKARRDKGETAASLSDYDRKTLEWLCPHVDPLLDRDPSHSGKLEVFKKTVNRACHDNTPPGTEEMKQACGEIRRFAKDYFGR